MARPERRPVGPLLFSPLLSDPYRAAQPTPTPTDPRSRRLAESVATVSVSISIETSAAVPERRKPAAIGVRNPPPRG